MMLRHYSGMSASVPIEDRGYVRKLADVIRTRGKSLLWSGAVQVETEDTDKSEEGNMDSDEDLLVFSNEGETPVEATYSSSTSSMQGTSHMEEDDSIQRQPWTRRR